MEEKKLDLNSIIGFVLIFGILLYMFYQNEQKRQAEELEKASQEQVDQNTTTQTDSLNVADVKEQPEDLMVTALSDSSKVAALQNKLGALSYAYTIGTDIDDETIVSTDVLDLKFKNKGGFLSEVKLKKFVDYDSVPVYLVKDNNVAFNINLGTTDNRTLNTAEQPFQPSVTKNGENTIVSMKLKFSETKFLEYRYVLKPNDYMIDFSIRSEGMNTVINSSQEINLDWDLKGLRQAKSITYENRYTRLTYQHDGGKIDKLSQMNDDEETELNVSWLSYRQHFFSTILVPEQPLKSVKLTSTDLVKDEEVDSVYTKQYNSKFALLLNNGGELDNDFGFYYGPTDAKVLKSYGKNLEESIPFGWGIFGWINKAVFIPLFGWLSGFLPYGIAIIVMTVLVKIMLSFVQYKQFLSQAKMKILKPELDAIREKHKDNKMKAQQETMALQSKAGASPMAGCLPGLMQIPVFYALFMFFPTAFALRQKSFLWADDLSSYDVVAELPFNIPFYGDHVSLFPILAAIAIFFYMRMTTGQQMANQPTQEGMPDMAKMMKYMIYFSPLLMLIFFNQYASGLSLYYFISNLISIGIMLVIKNYIIDEKKVLAKIEVNKSKPKKQNKFQRKMQEMMEQAEKQKQAQQRKNK